MLDLSRYQPGTLTANPRPLPLLEALERVVPDDGVEIDVLPDLVVEADELVLERVIGNLVANARRYGADPITVSASQVNGSITLAVEDRGEGVPPDFVPHLFSRFTRSPDAASKESRGAGLAIAAGVRQGTRERAALRPHEAARRALRARAASSHGARRRRG